MLNALSDLRVLEVSETIKGRYCARLFADWGADVIQVNSGREQQFAWLDLNKRSLRIDLDRPEGRGAFDELIRCVDVVVHDLPDERADEMGLSYERIRGELPRLVFVRLTDLGASGPWATRPSTDLIVSALSGLCLINGEEGRLPLREPGNQTYLAAAMFGFLGALAALERRHASGRGQAVESSAIESVLSILSPSVLQVSYQDKSHERRPPGRDYLFACKDGWVSIILAADKPWETLKSIWNIQVDKDDDRFISEGSRRKNLDAMNEVIEPILKDKTRKEIFDELSALRVICGMLLSPAELAADQHLKTRRSLIEVRGDGEDEDVFHVPASGFRPAGNVIWPPRQRVQDVAPEAISASKWPVRLTEVAE